MAHHPNIFQSRPKLDLRVQRDGVEAVWYRSSVSGSLPADVYLRKEPVLQKPSDWRGLASVWKNDRGKQLTSQARIANA